METYKLEYPFEDIANEIVETLKVRRMNAGDVMALNEGDSEGVQTGKMLGRLCGLDIDDVKKLDVVDFQELQLIVGKQRASRQTGAPIKKS